MKKVLSLLILLPFVMVGISDSPVGTPELTPGGSVISLPVPLPLPDCTNVQCAACPDGTTPIYSTHECCPICPEVI